MHCSSELDQVYLTVVSTGRDIASVLSTAAQMSRFGRAP